MFTGLVEALGVVEAVIEEPPGCRLAIREAEIARGASIGDSVAINGCCLTVVRVSDGVMEFEAGPETLVRTNLGRFAAESRVNLERSLKVGDRMGGHFVTGHVDGLGTLTSRKEDGEWCEMWFDTPAALLKQMSSKGSVAVDGISLTLVEVTGTAFSVALIPHTLAVTTLGTCEVGDSVNLETDLLAKYVEQQLTFRAATE